MRRLSHLLLLSAFCAASLSVAAAPSEPRRFENARLEVRLMPRTPEQIAAFYIGRKFPEDMVAELRARCFITVGIRNKSDDIVWLDLAQWRFADPAGALERYDRDYWKRRWEAMGAPLPAQSTFRWTLLPEELDFRPGEAEGGNIILPRRPGPYVVEALFPTGAERTGEPIRVRFEPLTCAE